MMSAIYENLSDDLLNTTIVFRYLAVCVTASTPPKSGGELRVAVKFATRGRKCTKL